MKKQFAVDADRAPVPAFRPRFRWLLVGFALALVLLGINAAFAIHSIGIIAANQVLVADTNEVLLEIAGLKLDFVKVQRGVGGFIITGNPELFKVIDSSEIEAGHRFDRIVTLTSDNPVQQQRLEKLHAYMASFLDFQQQVQKKAQRSRQGAAVLISGGEGITRLAAIDHLAGEIQGEENRLLAVRSAQTQQSVQRSYATFLVGSCLALVAVVWLSIATLLNLLERHHDALRIYQLVGEVQTRAEQLEGTVERRTVELSESNKALEAFTYSVSHDLKEPLRGMAGMANILIEDYRSLLPEDAHRYLNSIIESAKRMDRLIDNLLVFARLNHGEFPLIAVNLDQVISEVCRQFHWQIQQSGAVVEVGSPLPTVLANRSVLIQVFLNFFPTVLNSCAVIPVRKLRSGRKTPNGTLNFGSRITVRALRRKTGKKFFIHFICSSWTRCPIPVLAWVCPLSAVLSTVLADRWVSPPMKDRAPDSGSRFPKWYSRSISS